MFDHQTRPGDVVTGDALKDGELPRIWPSGPGMDPMQKSLHKTQQLVATVDQKTITLTD